MNLSLNDEQMQTVIAGAVLQMLTPENREELIRGAVVHLMTPPKKDGWGGSPKSPIQEAFDRSVSTLAFTMVREMLAGDEAFKAQLRSLIARAMEKAFEKSDDIATRLGNTLGDFFSKAASDDSR